MAVSAPELSMTRAGRYTKAALMTDVKGILMTPVGAISPQKLFKILRSCGANPTGGAPFTDLSTLIVERPATMTGRRFW